MSCRFYKLALWYIGKCNSKWENRHKKVVELLDRLTYKNFGKYVLLYGADAEWQNFSRYDVLDNAIQRLAQYEDAEQEIRNKAIDEFAKSLKTDYVNFDLYYILQDNNFAFENTSLKSYQDMIEELAEQVKGGAK